MRQPLAIAAAVAASAALAVPALAATKTVKVGDNYFVRDHARITVTIKRNDTVKWRWAGSGLHNVTVRSGPQRFKPSKTQTKGTFTHRFSKRGTYRLYCSVHGAKDQSMTLVVR